MKELKSATSRTITLSGKGEASIPVARKAMAAKIEKRMMNIGGVRV